jgi:hypothetical protein
VEHAVRVHAPARQPSPRQMTLPPLAWALLLGAGVLLMLMVVGIAIQIAILENSRDHMRAQDKKSALLLRRAEAAAPAAQQAVPLIRDARPLVRKLRRAIRGLSGSGTSIESATARLPAIARAVQALAQFALPALDAASAVSAQVLHRDRLARALDAANELLAEVSATDLVEISARAGRQVPRLTRRLIKIQLATLRTQRRSLTTQLKTLGIQRKALVHIESIDRKTGGPVPAPVP